MACLDVGPQLCEVHAMGLLEFVEEEEKLHRNDPIRIQDMHGIMPTDGHWLHKSSQWHIAQNALWQEVETK